VSGDIGRAKATWTGGTLFSDPLSSDPSARGIVCGMADYSFSVVTETVVKTSDEQML